MDEKIWLYFMSKSISGREGSYNVQFYKSNLQWCAIENHQDSFYDMK